MSGGRYFYDTGMARPSLLEALREVRAAERAATDPARRARYGAARAALAGVLRRLRDGWPVKPGEIADALYGWQDRPAGGLH